MHLGILFYSDTIALTQEASSVKGRAIANNDFVRALLQHRAPVDSITLFVTSPTEREFVRTHFGTLLDQSGVALLTFAQTPAFLKKNRLDVLHLLGPDLYRGFFLRNEVMQYSCVVTGVTHSLGHAPFLEWVALNALHGAMSCDRLVCTTPTAASVVAQMQQQMRPYFPTATQPATTVIPLGIDLKNFSAPVPHMRRELGIPDHATVVLWVGRLSYYLKVDLLPLLLAFRGLSAQSPQQEIRLILAGATGTDDYDQLLRSAIAEWGLAGAVHLVTNPSDMHKRQLYHSADIFVAPCDSYQETFGLTLLEAMAAGLPIVAADWDGYRALVLHERTGFLVPTCTQRHSPPLQTMAPLQLDSINHLSFGQSTAMDQSILRARLQQLAQAPTLRRTMRTAALERIARYDWSQIVTQYRALWCELMVDARTHTATPAPGPTLDYRNCFAAYPSHHLQSTDRFVIADDGRAALTGTLNLRVYSVMEELISVPLLQRVLPLTSTPCTVAHLITQLAAEFSATDVEFHLLWLFKYGLVQRAADCAGA